MASLGGLLLQLAALAIFFWLAAKTGSWAATQFAWFTGGGLLIWLTALLVARQHELVVQEQRDLELLRREKQTIGGEAMFDADGAGGLGYRVAEARLKWMQRWLVPVMGVLNTAYLGAIAIWQWRALPNMEPRDWARVAEPELALIITAFMLFLLFLYSRYAAGMGRIREWHLLRACGGYMLATALLAFALIICVGVQRYRPDIVSWERVLAHVIPIFMAVLGLETFLNFLFDIYRPRTPGTQARACFDSRLLGLFSEPGGLAHSIAEAINYQFGFQVTHTWFYQLLQRTIVPLAGLGLVSLWLLSCIVVVQPYESVIIARWGRMLAPEAPLGPGLHFKLPYPISVALRENTQQLHQIIIGAKYRETDKETEREDHELLVVLWTDRTHASEHFNFLVNPPPREERQAAGRLSVAGVEGGLSGRGGRGENLPVHILRMSLAVQYKINPRQLASYLSNMQDVGRFVETVSWQELVRFCANTDTTTLLGKGSREVGHVLKRRISERLAAMNLGIDIHYVGMQSVHPEPSVGEAFEQAVAAEQEKIGNIREAYTEESRILSQAAGDVATARAVARAIGYQNAHIQAVSRAEMVSRQADPTALAAVREQLDGLTQLFTAHIEAGAAADLAEQLAVETEQRFDLGMEGTVRQVSLLKQAAADARRFESEADAPVKVALDRIRQTVGSSLSDDVFDALATEAEAQVGQRYWDLALERMLPALGGQSAATLAEARARRWQLENMAAADLIRLEADQRVYNASPELYKARRRTEVLVEAAKVNKARKYLLAFDPGGRNVRIRIEAQEESVADVTDLPTRLGGP